MGRQRLGGPIFDNPRLRPTGMGGPIFDNPRLRMAGMGSALGRRGYYVPPAAYVSSDSRGGYGPGRRPRPGYKVKAKRDTPAQKRLARCSRKCSGKTRAKYKVCIRRCVKRKSKR